jgi:Protein of unknown function (DUF559)
MYADEEYRHKERRREKLGSFKPPFRHHEQNNPMDQSSVNVELPIAFDSFGRMEVDLLCTESRLVVEIDGPQHLADAAAYRRDRRNDQLMQENGYLLLRFLAEDVARELDAMLDGILRSLSQRRRAADDQYLQRGRLRLSRLHMSSKYPSRRAD